MITNLRRLKFCIYLILGGLLIFPNFIYAAEKTAYPTNDPFYKEQWYLDKINITDAWKYTTGSPKVIVAVIDSGVDIDHPDLRGNIWVNDDEKKDGIDNDKNGYIDDIYGWDFIKNSADPRPKVADNGFTEEGINHGTIVAGIIAAKGNNKIGISGISWHSKIMPLRVLDGNGQGDISEVVEAIDYAINNGADIINLSFVGNKNDWELEKAIKRAELSGITVVAAAGNEGFADLDSQFLAYKKEYNGGVNVAAGDVDNDGQTEIITGPTNDHAPVVQIFDSRGVLERVFLAYAEHFRGGVNVAAGDIDGDGIDEIITGAGFTGGPHVRIFDTQGRVKGQFFAYAEHFRGGVNVAAGDIMTKGISEIISGAGEDLKNSAYVRIKSLSNRTTIVNLNKFPLYPICYDLNNNNLIGVASADVDGRKSVFSNYGNNCVDFAAPGEFFFGLKSEIIDIESKDYGGYWSGTSLATPIVSGTIALMKSIQQNITPKEIIQIIAQTSDKSRLKDGEVLFGNINTAKVIQAIKEKVN
jgi:subtilisin family serine protease